MATFHPFPRLPTELRLQIWEMTVEPRIVDVRVDHEAYPYAVPSAPKRWLASTTPVPAVLHTCSEARNHGLYKRVFSELNANCDEESRYVWANLDFDMIDIGETPVECYEAVAGRIQRLKMRRANSDESFYHFESKDLHMFTNLKLVHVVCADGLRSWWNAGEEHGWPCGAENLYFIDPDDGTMMSSAELDELCEKEQQEAWAREDEQFRQSRDEWERGMYEMSGERP